MILVIEPVVGYMLKLLKSGIKIEAFKDEFNAIRHGNYKDFLRLTNGPLPFMVKWNSGEITNESNNPNYDCDFEGLFKSGPSLKIFYINCVKHYGEVNDTDIPDIVYHNVVTFEIAIRMHATNAELLNSSERINLKQVIDLLCVHHKIDDEERMKLHAGRRFINMVKHFNHQFPSWQIGITHFMDAFSVLEKHRMLIL